MSAYVYLATLGQRPEAITIAFDKLSEKYTYEQMVILHTDAQQSGIVEALQDLDVVLQQDYPKLHIEYHELRNASERPIIDIVDELSANQYYEAVAQVLTYYRQQGYTMHLMIAGGRKAMSIYAMLAAQQIFTVNDRVFTVLSDTALLQRNLYHIPVGKRQYVQVVDLPLMRARRITTPVEGLPVARSLRDLFLEKLTDEERKLVSVLLQHPYATAEELGLALQKSKRTVENQFRTIYDKMSAFLDDGEHIKRNKRQALLTLLKN